MPMGPGPGPGPGNPNTHLYMVKFDSYVVLRLMGYI